MHSVTPCPSPPHLFIEGLGFLKNHRKVDQDFLVKMGDSPYGVGGCL